MDGAGYVALGVERGAANIEQHKIGKAALERIVHVPAVGFKGKGLRKIGDGICAGGGGNVGDVVAHGLRCEVKAGHFANAAACLQLAQMT